MAYEKAAALFEEVIKQAEQMGRSWLKLWGQAELSRSLLQSERLDEVNLEWSNKDLWNTPTALTAEKPVLLGEVALRKGKFKEALRLAKKSASEAEEHGWKAAYVTALELQLRILLQLDRPKEVISLGEKGVLIAEQMNYSSIVLHIRVAKARAQALLGNVELAANQYRAAVAIIQELANNMGDAQLKQSFLSNNFILSVLKLA